MGRFNLLDLKYSLTQRWGMAFGRWFPLMSWQEGFLKVERIIPNAIGLFKRFFKRNFSQVKSIWFWVQIRRENLQDQKPSLGWIQTKILVIKENFWEGEFFRRKFKYPPQIKIKVWKIQLKFLGVTDRVEAGEGGSSEQCVIATAEGDDVKDQVLGESKQNTCHKRKSLRGRVL